MVSQNLGASTPCDALSDFLCPSKASDLKKKLLSCFWIFALVHSFPLFSPSLTSDYKDYEQKVDKYVALTPSADSYPYFSLCSIALTLVIRRFKAAEALLKKIKLKTTKLKKREARYPPRFPPFCPQFIVSFFFEFVPHCLRCLLLMFPL